MPNPLIFLAVNVGAAAAIVAIKKVGTVLEEGGEAPINFRMPTMGGKFFWKTLAEKNGWKVQQNVLFKNCRILDSNGWRIAWGGGGALNVFLEQMPVLADVVVEAQKQIAESKDT